MNVVKNVKDNIGNSLLSVGTGLVTGFGTRAIISMATEPKTGTAIESGKKRFAQGAALVVGILGFAAVKGSDTPAIAMKSAALGTALINGMDLLADVFKSDAATLPDNTVGKVVRAGLGLGCPCQSGVAESRYYPSLNQPVYDNLTWDQLRAIRDANIDAQDTPLLNVTNDSAWQSMPV